MSAATQQKLKSLERRRQLAQAMMSQFQIPSGTQMSGTGQHPMAVQNSPLALLASLGGQYFGSKMNSKLDDEYGEVAKAMSAEKMKALQDLIARPTAAPATSSDEGPTRAPMPQTGAMDPMKMQAAIDEGVDPSVIAASAKGDEAYSLSPGQTRFRGSQQIASLPSTEKQDQQLEVIVGPDGKPQYVPRAEAVGKQAYRTPGINVNVGDKLPTPQSGMGYVKDPSSPFGYKLMKIPGARDSRSGAEQKAALLSQRMTELSSDIVNEAPSITSQQAATYAQKGGVGGAVANNMLSEKQQKHFNAARGWLAGILRQDTGAVISPQEVAEYYPTYFPVPGDSAAVIEQKRKLRVVTEKGLTAIGGADSQTPAGDGARAVDVSKYLD